MACPFGHAYTVPPTLPRQAIVYLRQSTPRQVHRPAAPVAVHGQVRVGAVQLARPAATVLARATPQVVMKRAAQRQRRIVNARRQPSPEREQLPLAQL